MASGGGVPAAGGKASWRASSTMRDNIIKVFPRPTSAFTRTTICEQGRPTEFYQWDGTGARDGTRIGNAEPGRGRGAGIVGDDREARGNTWLRDSALSFSKLYALLSWADGDGDNKRSRVRDAGSCGAGREISGGVGYVSGSRGPRWRAGIPG